MEKNKKLLPENPTLLRSTAVSDQSKKTVWEVDLFDSLEKDQLFMSAIHFVSS